MSAEANPADAAGAADLSSPTTKPISLYETLGVAPSATTVEITAAYRKLALANHPDRPDGSTDRFQELQRAYEVLNTPSRRCSYDLLLKQKPTVRNFTRPPKLEQVEKPVYALLADLNFYEFEGSPSKIRSSFHYGDGIECNHERGSCIGLAGDGYIYWTISGRGYATPLCKADSDMSLSSVRVVYRSNLPLKRKPLERSRADNQPVQSPMQTSLSPQHRVSNSSFLSSTGGTTPSVGGGGGAPTVAPRKSEAERIREQLRNKERHRSATKRLEKIEQEESDERDGYEQQLWERFWTLHTTLETAMRCFTLSIPVPEELARFVGYDSPEIMPIQRTLSGETPNTTPTTNGSPNPQTFLLWLDPLEANNDEDEDEETAEDFTHLRDHGEPSQSREDNTDATNEAEVSSVEGSRSSSESGSASDGDSCRARPTAGPKAMNRPRNMAVSNAAQPPSSSPMVPGSLRPMRSSTSSLGRVGQGAAIPAHRRSVSGISVPSANPSFVAPGHAGAEQVPVSQRAPSHSASPSSPSAAHFATLQPLCSSTMTADPDSHNTSHTSRAAAAGSGDNATGTNSAFLPAPLARGTAGRSNLRSPQEAMVPGRREGTTAPLEVMDSLNSHPGTESSMPAYATGSKEDTTPASRPLYPWSVQADQPSGTRSRSNVMEAIPDVALWGVPDVAPSTATATKPPTPDKLNDGRRSSSPEIAVRHSLSPQMTRETTRSYCTPSVPTLSETAAMHTGGTAQSPAITPAAAALGDRDDETQPADTTGALSQPRFSAHGPSVGRDGSLGHVGQRGSQAAAVPAARAASATATKTGVTAKDASASPNTGSHMAEATSEVARHSSEDRSMNVSAATYSADLQRRHVDASAAITSSADGTQLPTFPIASAARYSTANAQSVQQNTASSSIEADMAANGGLRAATKAPAQDPRITMAPLRLFTSLDGAAAPASAETEDDTVLVSPNAAAALAAKKKRSKGRITPRYMLSTEAHARRSNVMPSDSPRTTGTNATPRLDTNHAYSSMTAEEMFAEEEEFMNSFAKTKRVT